MRTTISLDDEIFDLTKHLAEQRRISLSEAVNLLIKRGLSSPMPRRERNGFALFDVAEGASQFGPEDVERAINEEDKEFAAAFFRRS